MAACVFSNLPLVGRSDDAEGGVGVGALRSAEILILRSRRRWRLEGCVPITMLRDALRWSPPHMRGVGGTSPHWAKLSGAHAELDFAT